MSFFSDPGSSRLSLLTPHGIRSAVSRLFRRSTAMMQSPALASASFSTEPAQPEPPQNQHNPGQQPQHPPQNPSDAKLTLQHPDNQQQNEHGRSEPSSEAPTSPRLDTSSIIAHSPTVSTAAPSASSPTNISSRKAVCTHMRMMRIYGPYKCHHCGRVPRLGWVYRCIQDFGDDLIGFNHRDDDDFTSALRRRLQQESTTRRRLSQVPENTESRPLPAPPDQSAETSAQPDDSVSQRVQEQRNVSDTILPPPALKPWMQKLAIQGLYTPEQTSKLQAQRQRVLECISGSNRPHQLSKLQLRDATISDPTTLLMNSNYTRRVPPNAFSSRSCTIAPYWQTSHDDVSAQPCDSTLIQTPPARSVCNYQTCSTCRPSSRDRTWQCIDPAHYCTPDSGIQLPSPSVDNRLISHPALIHSACHKIHHPDPIPADSGMYSPTYDEDDDDEFFYDDDDYYGSGYDTSEISPDISSGQSLEGTPTSPHFDENRGWDRPNPGWSTTSPWSRPQPLRRASSMDPKLLRSSRDLENMDLTAGFRGLGLGIGGAGNAGADAEQGTTAESAGDATSAGDTDTHVVVGDWFVRPGAEAAMGFRSDNPVDASSKPAPANVLVKKASEEVVVQGGSGRAVTEEAVTLGDPDIIMQA